ncbi:MAG: phosphoribosylanthranilate isomerase [Rhodospirillaceae bacterium]|nr:phosphoribosylanthranilate isomerase [Rhodospirillaceae bacterium]|tara:strand:+ start:562 stop:1212 length:651 start_codon:yes stop_codon:yes gene_type:complete
MTVDAKICGVSDRAAINASVDGGARYVGFVFFPRSPRHVTPTQAAALSALLPESVIPVALAVDPNDDLIAEIDAQVGISMFQLHGSETSERVADIKSRTGKPVMKAIRVSAASDFDSALSYLDVADMLLFDAKPPSDMANALPGGNAVSFDWTLLAGRDWPLPWMLSGGLDPKNIAEAIGISRAAAVDVSSGVESSPGVKDAVLISEFLEAVNHVQ